MMRVSLAPGSTVPPLAPTPAAGPAPGDPAGLLSNVLPLASSRYACVCVGGKVGGLIMFWIKRGGGGSIKLYWFIYGDYRVNYTPNIITTRC